MIPTYRVPAPGVDLADYERAHIWLAWTRRASDNARRLLFAMVELLPLDIAGFGPGPEHRMRLGSSSTHSIYFRRVAATFQTAVAWYEAALQGRWTRPGNDGNIGPASPDGFDRELGERVCEPAWPHLVVHPGNDESVPFLPRVHECPRLHLNLHAHPAPPSDWSSAELLKAIAFIREHLGFDISVPGHLWNSVHLVAPNPVFRTVHTRLRADDPSSPGEGVLLSISLRPGRDVNGLHLHLLEQREQAWRCLFSGAIPTHNFEVDAVDNVAAAATYVTSDRYGLLYASGPFAFLRSFQLTLGLISDTRRIHLPAKKNVPATTYDVQVVGRDRPRSTGAPGPRQALQLLHQARTEHLQIAASSTLRQVWFSGAQAEAQDALRRLVRPASNIVRIIDYFFGAEELPRYLPAVGNTSTRLQLLTSKEGLRKRRMLTEDGLSYREQLLALQQINERLHAAQAMNALEIRVMPGKRAEVHDRFLIVDKRIWLLGSSLNEFGSRGTMMVTLHAPGLIRPVLDEAWERAVSLDEALVTTEDPE